MNDEKKLETLSPKETFARIIRNVEQVISGQTRPLRLILAAIASGGHVLLEDYPGTGKTTMAKAIAHSLGAKFKRVQFTPDLLPSDILGVSVFDQRQQVFNFREGPIFTNILLADEINRASPRTQSALLEAMAESQVSIEGNTFKLAELFFVIATQNPVEFRGTYPLPEAQMDRFAMRLSLGYVDLKSEVAIVVNQGKRHPLETISSCVSLDEVHALKQAVKEIHISDELQHYAVSIVRATRSAPSVQMGAGPRASLALIKSAQALALLDGSDFVTPEHLHELLTPVIAHRIVADPKARFSGITPETIINEIIKVHPVPG
ncbi:MAG TPA: MoxR family ATPase [Gammaproteobacteria bacterium]|nr:MoxR family ATPase [Gammaproteobacteria bacterium]